MENQVVVRQIEKALHQLYSDPVQANKTSAEKWLMMVQNAQEAWQLSWQLLQHQNIEVQNFGALMLQSKISKGWQELPQEQYEPLRLELFRAILRFSSGPRLVLTRLCVAMVMYMFHAVPDMWPNAVVSSIQTLQSAQSSNSSGTSALLQLLQLIPEEFERTSSSPLVSKRSILRQEIQKGVQSVFSVLHNYISSAGVSVSLKQAALSCLRSWTQFSLPLPELRPLVSCLFQLIYEEELCCEAADTLSGIVAHQDSYKYPSSLKEFITQVLQLSDLIHSLLNDQEADMEVCCFLCHLVVDTLESNMDMLTGLTEESPDDCEEALDSLQLLLTFTTQPGNYPVNEKYSEITFQFWEKFLDLLASQTPEHSCFLLEFYNGILTSLIETFPVKCQFPAEDDWEDVWDEDNQDDFLKYREDMCDIGESLQRTLHSEYLQSLALSLNNHLSQSSSPSWQAVEAILFLLQGVTRNVSKETSVYFRNILSLFPQMPLHHTLVKTAFRLLGDLSSWFQENSDLLPAVLPMILQGLTQPNVAAAAALAFKDVCIDCCQLLIPLVYQIIPHCQSALDNPSFPRQECSMVVAAVGSVLSAMPLSELVSPLESLITSRVESFQQLAGEQPSILSHPLVLRELTILSALCHYICPTLLDGEQHPVAVLLVKLWPSLESLLSKWMGDPDVLDTLCVCWNRAIRNVNQQYIPLVERTIQLIVKCFAASHHYRLLDSAARLMHEFGSTESCRPLLSALLEQLLSHSMQLCQHGLHTMDPNTLQALLGLLATTFKYIPSLLMNSEEVLDSVFNLALSSLQLPEQPTITLAISILVEVVSLGPVAEPINKLLLSRGRGMVDSLLRGIGGKAPRSHLNHYSELLISMVVHCITQLSQWMEELLSQEGYPSQHMSLLEKQVFRQTILRARGNKTLIRDKVKEFSLMCRGFHGTLYAAETS